MDRFSTLMAMSDIVISYRKLQVMRDAVKKFVIKGSSPLLAHVVIKGVRHKTKSARQKSLERKAERT